MSDNFNLSIILHRCKSNVTACMLPKNYLKHLVNLTKTAMRIRQGLHIFCNLNLEKPR